jgi:hypothetical protein
VNVEMGAVRTGLSFRRHRLVSEETATYRARK